MNCNTCHFSSKPWNITSSPIPIIVCKCRNSNSSFYKSEWTSYDTGCSKFEKKKKIKRPLILEL